VLAAISQWSVSGLTRARWPFSTSRYSVPIAIAADAFAATESSPAMISESSPKASSAPSIDRLIRPWDSGESTIVARERPTKLSYLTGSNANT
jgi:hypothetical protein